MIKILAVALLVLVPLLWGAGMVPILDFLERKLFKISGDEGESDV